MKDITTILEERKTRLQTIINSNYPIDPKLSKAHNERVEKAAVYVKEIESLFSLLPIDSKVYVVPINTFEKKMETSDFATIEDEGFFFRLAHISNFPCEDIYLLYFVPLSSI